LKLMGQPPDARITPDIGRQICSRDGVKAMLTGSIASIGTQYLITLNAVNAATGDNFAQEQLQAAKKEEVLNTLGAAVSSLRGKLGESLASVKKFDKPLDEATTSSLEALKAYSEATHLREKGNESGAVALLKHALELDPNFASAHATLGTTYENLGENELYEKSLKQAFDLKDRASEREKLYIEGHYYDSIGDIDKSLQTWQLYRQTYPNDEIPTSNLAVLYGRLGDFEKDLQMSLEGIRLAPESNYGYLNASWSYIALGRFEESKAIANQSFKRVGNAGMFHTMLALTALTQGDTATEEKETALGRDNAADLVRFVIPAQANRTAGLGQLKRAQEILQKSIELTQSADDAETRASAICEKSLLPALLGDKSGPKIDPAAVLTISKSPNVKACIADALALSGRDAEAVKLADELAHERPNDTWFQTMWIPAVRAQIEVNHGNGAKAVELLLPAKPYDKSNAEIIALRGRAYLLNHQPKEAAAEFQFAIKLQTEAFQNPSAWLAELYLARAYAMDGDSAKARTAYQNFFVSWKDADPGQPLLAAAKAEYAKLP